MTLPVVRSRAAPTERRPHAVPTRIVVLTSSFPRFEGDFAGRFVADAVAHLRARGLHVDVVCPERPADGGGLVRTLARRPWLAVSLSVSLTRALRRAARDADLVHAHWLGSAPSRASPAGRSSSRCTAPARPGRSPTFRSLHARRGSCASSCVRRARCSACRARSRRRCARSASSTRAGFRTASTCPRRNCRPSASGFVLFAGRLSPEKGIAELVEATGGLPLVVAGDGPLRTLVPDALGFVPHPELEQLYARAAVVVFPSRQEGLARLAARGDGARLPGRRHACRRHPAARRARPQRTARPAARSRRARAAIEALLADPDLGRRLGREARRARRSLCSWERVTDATLEAYGTQPAELPRRRSESVSGVTAPEHEP